MNLTDEQLREHMKVFCEEWQEDFATQLDGMKIHSFLVEDVYEDILDGVNELKKYHDGISLDAHKYAAIAAIASRAYALDAFEEGCRYSEETRLQWLSYFCIDLYVSFLIKAAKEKLNADYEMMEHLFFMFRYNRPKKALPLSMIGYLLEQKYVN